MAKIRIAITGGIGSGKSYVCRRMQQMGYPVFDTDTAARNEMLENGELRARLRKLVSPDVFRADGSLNKPVIRAFLHSSAENAALFDGEVHPCVRQRWRRWAENVPSDVAVMECALLYEARFDNEVNYVVAVTAPEETRVRRVMERDGIPAETVRKWIGMQLSDAEKTRRADFALLNDGTADIDCEIHKLVDAAKKKNNL